MKTYLFLAAWLCLGFTAALAQTPVAKVSGPNASWDKTSHSFGNIALAVPVTATFKVTNNGTAPLIISEVTPSCGCTTPDYTKEPILPGKSGYVKAAYNAASPGAFNKTITVKSNSATDPLKVLTITGTVDSNGQ